MVAIAAVPEAVATAATPPSKAALMAGVGAVAVVLERLSRAYLEDGELTMDEVNSAFSGFGSQLGCRGFLARFPGVTEQRRETVPQFLDEVAPPASVGQSAECRALAPPLPR